VRKEKQGVLQLLVSFK